MRLHQLDGHRLTAIRNHRTGSSKRPDNPHRCTSPAPARQVSLVEARHENCPIALGDQYKCPMEPQGKALMGRPFESSTSVFEASPVGDGSRGAHRYILMMDVTRRAENTSTGRAQGRTCGPELSTFNNTTRTAGVTQCCAAV